MRSISLSLALLGAVTVAGCGGGATSGGEARGVAEGSFSVTIQNGQGGNDSLAITAGYVTSSVAGIDCGVAPHAACSASFPLGSPVTLTAVPVGTGVVFNGWAGDCLNDDPSGDLVATCTLTGNADKYVIALFGTPGDRTAHPSWADGAVHATKFREWAADPVGYGWKCRSCHGQGLMGAAIAPSCASCHASMTLHSGAYFQAKLAAAAPADGPAVTTVCLECHAPQAAGFMATQHWSWQGPTPQLQGLTDFAPDGSALNPGTIGKANLVNNFCVSVAANERRCDQCHAGYGSYGTNESARSAAYVNDATRVDCLICHTKSVAGNMAAGGYNKIAGAFGAAGFRVGPGMSGLPTTAQLQGWATDLQKPSRDNCGWCHFNGGGADSVKVLSTALMAPAPAVDVHMSPAGGDMTCADCHADSDHKIKGAGVHTPTSFARLSCEDCHGAGPHASATLNGHLDTVACQSCHIPAYSRGMPGKIDWDWSTAGWKTPAFPHPATLYACVSGTAEVPYDGNGCLTAGGAKVKKYDYMKGTFAWGQNVPPVYRWYNGKTTHVTTLDKGAFTIETGLTPAVADRITLAAPLGDRADLTAKIHPFKLMTGRQAVYVDDAAGGSFVITPNLFHDPADGADGGFWGVLSAQPPGTIHSYEYTSAVATDAFGAPAGPLAGDFVLGPGTGTATAFGGYTFGAAYPLETLLSKVFTKGSTMAGQYASATPMVRFDGTNPGWDWRYTKMYMDLEHEVAPATQALGCGACHGAGPGNTPFFEGVGYASDPMYDPAARRTP